MNPLRLIPRRLLPQTAWGDREFSRRRFVRKQGRRPKPQEPHRLTDYLYRIKTNGSLTDPLCQFVTDKEFAKLYIGTATGSDYLPETYRVLRNECDIDAFVPDRVSCVVKPTHLSGLVLFYTDSDVVIDRDLLRIWLQKDHYRGTREANYRYLKPKIIVEEFLSGDGVNIPKDYKIFCFGGMPKMIQVDSDRFGEHTQNFYDLGWSRLPITFGVSTGPKDDEKPRLLEEMLLVAATLAAPFIFVRVDLYVSDTGIKVGELTLCPRGLNDRIFPAAADIELGKLFDPGYRLDARACAEAWAAG